uniref:Uncharacterized protein n=1 Tax=viral metagenome TaxID=1070528 RepID=A0A6C0ARK1_9ZZZZ
MSSKNKTGGSSDKTLLLYQPMNIIVFLIFNSPLILAIGVTGMSFIFQNPNGFVYLGFLLVACIVRSFSYAYLVETPSSKKTGGDIPITGGNDANICGAITYSPYGNPTFSSFVFAFTIMYLSLPMFSRGAPNYWVFSSLVTYFLVDMFLKLYKGCIVSYGDLFLNVLLGTAFAAAFVTAMYAGGSSKYLLFNEVASNREICTQPKTQTFKCNLYKNGELVGNL